MEACAGRFEVPAPTDMKLESVRTLSGTLKRAASAVVFCAVCFLGPFFGGDLIAHGGGHGGGGHGGGGHGGGSAGGGSRWWRTFRWSCWWRTFRRSCWWW